MSKCLVCKKTVEEYTVAIEIRGSHYPRSEIDSLATICPNCGVIRLASPDNSYTKLLSDGYPEVKEDDLKQIDLDTIFSELTLPGRDHGEELKWVDPEEVKEHRIYKSYQKTFKNGFPNQGKFKRLVHFLKMDQNERLEGYGPVRATSLRIIKGGDLVFREGRTRFLLFIYLGAKRIPVSIAPEYAENASDAGLTLYDSIE